MNNIENISNTIEGNVQKQENSGLEKVLSSYKLKAVPKSFIGFSKIASQIHKDAISHGFQLNLMIVGCTGLGKSSFLNHLFHTKFPETLQGDCVSESAKYILVENNVKLRLKIIEVPDFGKKINNSDCWQSINNYFEKCFARQLLEEQRIIRSPDYSSNDNLVHLCLYFIQPSGEDHCLRELDLEFLKNAHDKVNIIPLIAKADSMTQEEIRIHKTNLLKELEEHGIKYFKFKVPKESRWRPSNPEFKYPDKKYILRLIDRFPFAVAAGNQTLMHENNQITIRSYPWGYIHIDDLNHCDTLAVRTLLMSVHLQELIVETQTIIYENYRSRFLGNASLKLAIYHQNEYHPLLFLDNYFRKVHSALGKKVSEMEAGFQELAVKKMDAIEKKRQDIDHECLEMSQEINFLYSKLEQECSYFETEKLKWDRENEEYNETFETLKIKKQGLLRAFKKFGR